MSAEQMQRVREEIVRVASQSFVAWSSTGTLARQNSQSIWGEENHVR
jgi:hypothetical protein